MPGSGVVFRNAALGRKSCNPAFSRLILARFQKLGEQSLPLCSWSAMSDGAQTRIWEAQRLTPSRDSSLHVPFPGTATLDPAPRQHLPQKPTLHRGQGLPFLGVWGFFKWSRGRHCANLREVNVEKLHESKELDPKRSPIRQSPECHRPEQASATAD